MRRGLATVAVAALAGVVAVIIVGAHGGGSPARTTAASFAAVADTSSAQDAPSTNFGGDTQLVDDNRRRHVDRSYLRFTVSGIPAGATIDDVSLRMTARQASSATANVKVVTGAWTESGLTYANAPAYDPTVVSDGTPSPIAAGRVTFDVTRAVHGDGTYDFVLTQTQAARTVWSSREGSSPPTLVVRYTAGATPKRTPTSSATATPTPTRTAHAGPCRGTPPPAGGYKHVVWILEENEAESTIDSSDMPYMTRLAGSCGRTTHLTAITHPSLPNYIALTSGGTQGVTNDDPPSHWTSVIGDADNIFHQLGTDWKALEDGMQSNCALSSGGSGYAVKHDPAAYYSNARRACATQAVPYDSSRTPDVGSAFTFVTPSLCHDGHDCSIRAADDWLKLVVPKILGSPAYAAGDTVLVITFDEGVGSDQSVYTTIVAPSVPPGTVSDAPYTHYSTLRATEDLLGLPPLGAAARAPSWVSAFNLG